MHDKRDKIMIKKHGKRGINKQETRRKEIKKQGII